MVSAADQASSKRSADVDVVVTPPKRLYDTSSSFPSSVPLPRSVLENSPPKEPKISPAFPSSIPLPPRLGDKALPPEGAGICRPPPPEKFMLPPAVEDKKDAEERRETKDKKEKKAKKAKKVKHAHDKVHDDLDLRRLFKVGQKQLTPPVADATRAFYTSLFEEKPESKIAIKYLVENGVLPMDEHRRLYKKYEWIKTKENELKNSLARQQLVAKKKAMRSRI